MFRNLFSRRTSILSGGLLSGATDRHSHILWGVDDGVKTVQESLEILSFLESAGLGTLWLTPHTAEDMPNTTESLQSRFADLKAAYQGKIELNLASEYMLDTLYEKHLEERDLLTMEEDTVLVETSTWNPPYNMDALLHATMSAGYRPLLAHPERYRYMEMPDYERLSAMGVRFQLNLPSLVGFYGSTARKKAETLLKKGMYSCWGSDCHRSMAIRRQYDEKELKDKEISLLKDL